MSFVIPQAKTKSLNISNESTIKPNMKPNEKQERNNNKQAKQATLTHRLNQQQLKINNKLIQHQEATIQQLNNTKQIYDSENQYLQAVVTAENEVQKIIKEFKMSPTSQNETTQENVLNQLKKQLQIQKQLLQKQESELINWQQANYHLENNLEKIQQTNVQLAKQKAEQHFSQIYIEIENRGFV
ncbi:Hypothetical_protein [Hexamita inflata]|uniref:Hypothetical_protein n=1 Tax=Hexamita inflata TaxID=28002 RepID=A0AA86UAA0_9EUKA|nr:Hypothetical protein HINF_LOCUS35114 [Hexamita inflata]